MKTNRCHKCGESLYFRKGTRKKKTSLRILSAGLSLSILLTGCGPLSATLSLEVPGAGQLEAARQESGSTDAVITGFGSLPEDVREQNVPLGTAIEELKLPDTLEAYVEEKDAENEGGG